MKVVNSKEMFDLEKQALASGISEKKMMKNAAKSIVKHLENSLEINLNAGISILVGKGNNGGDAIILGALLSRKYKVKIFEILKRSEDIAITLKREKPKDTNIELYEFNTNMINTIKLNIVALLDGIPYVFDFMGRDCLMIFLRIFVNNCANNIPDKNNTA